MELAIEVDPLPRHAASLRRTALSALAVGAVTAIALSPAGGALIMSLAFMTMALAEALLKNSYSFAVSSFAGGAMVGLSLGILS